LIFAQCAGSILVLSDRRWHRVIGYACYVVILFGSFVAVSRTLIFYAVCSLSFLMYVRTRSFLQVIAPLAVVSILSFAYAIFARKDIIQGEENFVVYYFGYGIIAFQQYVWPLSQYEWGVNSFGILGSMALGGAQSADLTLTIDEWNVYTFIAAPYRDFGILGVILVPFVFGGMWSYVWNSLQNRPFFLLFYSWMIFPCVIPFFDWKFSFTSYLYLVGAYLLFLKPRFRQAQAGTYSRAEFERPRLAGDAPAS
jgi:oligosaccharide repeat unit polymerase